jgi:Low affinity iron permease
MTKKFGEFANWVAVASGHPVAFGIAMITVAVWLGTGPVFSFSDTWQLVGRWLPWLPSNATAAIGRQPNSQRQRSGRRILCASHGGRFGQLAAQAASRRCRTFLASASSIRRA